MALSDQLKRPLVAEAETFKKRGCWNVTVESAEKEAIYFSKRSCFRVAWDIKFFRGRGFDGELLFHNKRQIFSCLHPKVNISSTDGTVETKLGAANFLCRTIEFNLGERRYIWKQSRRRWFSVRVELWEVPLKTEQKFEKVTEAALSRDKLAEYEFNILSKKGNISIYSTDLPSELVITTAVCVEAMWRRGRHYP